MWGDFQINKKEEDKVNQIEGILIICNKCTSNTNKNEKNKIFNILQEKKGGSINP